ncbi:serine hydrolase [Cellulophaga baltica]|uniref:serine hydrolase n=1 Tax=Cellulophaga baltica TaxID=76594 RepID=UPI0009F4CA70
MNSIINQNNFNGVIVVSTDSINIYSRAIGYSDLENKRQIKFDDQFVIGSISKQITAVLILREYEKGNLDLEDSINKYLEDIKTWFY